MDKRLAQLTRVIAQVVREPQGHPGAAEQADLELQQLLKDSAQRIADYQRQIDYQKQQFDFQAVLQVGQLSRVWGR